MASASQSELPSNSMNGYVCDNCGDRFYHPILIYGCDYGHFFCQTCFNQDYYEGNEPLCPYENCKTQICRMDKRNLQSKSSRNGITIKNMFPAPEKISRQPSFQSLSRTSYSSFYRGDGEALSSSRRPINCPYPGCRRTIAVTGLDSHFKYEHTSVAYINTYFQRRNNVTFNPYNLGYNRTLCIVMINLLDDLKRRNSVHSLKSITSDITLIKPVMLVMATRLTTAKTKDSDSEDEEISPRNLESCHVDKIIVWVASNIATNCKYALALSTPCKSVRLKYFGKVSLIHQDRAELCDQGKGLILSAYHSAGMTNNGTKPLTLDVILFPEQTNN